jgi:phage replication O-like protein O
MANPQLENGYTRIANEILDAFARTPSLGSEAFQVLMLVLRRTYGFQKKEAEMSISFIERGTGMKHSNVIRATKRLVSKRILAKGKNGLSLNKKHDEWVVSKRIPQYPNGYPPSIQSDTSTSIQTDTGVVSKRIPNKETLKETSKETLNKEILATASAVADKKDEAEAIKQVMEAFQMKLNPTINYGNKTQRDAVKYLLRLMGMEKLQRTIEYAASIKEDTFAPTITTPFQLKEKLATLMNYYQKQNKKGPMVAII